LKKKKKKTFTHLDPTGGAVRVPASRPANGQKFFWFFFFKKRTACLSAFRVLNRTAYSFFPKKEAASLPRLRIPNPPREYQPRAQQAGKS
jgi:hypothetical protein